MPHTADEVHAILTALKACSTLATKEQGKRQGRTLLKLSSLLKGTEIHRQAANKRCDTHPSVSNALVDMYSRCGSLQEAHRIFNTIQQKTPLSWNSLMLGYADNGKGESSLELFHEMLRQETTGCEPDGLSYVAALKGCICMAGKESGRLTRDGKSLKPMSLEKGEEIHSLLAQRSGYERDRFVRNTLMEMYGKCGKLITARALFEETSSKTISSWTVLIQAYTENGEPEASLELFSRMKATGFSPNAITYLVVLKACTGLATKEGGEMIKGKVVKLNALDKGMCLHAEAGELGFRENTYITNTLVDLYAKCGSMFDARVVFDRMVDHTVISWNSLMLGYVETGDGALALNLFSRLNSPNALSFVAAFKACSWLASKEEARLVNGSLVKVDSLEKAGPVLVQAESSGFDSDVFVCNTLIDMFSNCGKVVEAHRIFQRMEARRTAVSWTNLMRGYIDNGDEVTALKLFNSMEDEPSYRTFIAAFQACSGMAQKEPGEVIGGKVVKVSTLELAMQLHSRAQEAGFSGNQYVGSTLVDMYSKCGSLLDARRVFDCMASHSMVSWTALILGYADTGDGLLALELFFSMQRKGCVQDRLAYVAALKACVDVAGREEPRQQTDGSIAKVESLKLVTRVHSQARETGWSSDLYVASALVDVYLKCGSTSNARRVFDGMATRDVVVMTSLVLGYAEGGQGDEALKMFERIRETGLQPNDRSYVGALKACGVLASPVKARRVHAEIVRSGYEQMTMVANSLLDTYSKCGRMWEADRVFDSGLARDSPSWNALLTGYCRQGDVSRVWNVFRGMEEEEVTPTGVTFVAILTMCSHAGLLEKGRTLFEMMERKYLVRPSLEHYHCLVDILGRANDLGGAMSVIERMPYTPSAVTWRIVLAACSKWKNAEVGKVAFEKLLETDDKDVAGYSLMSNLFGTVI